MEEIKVVHYMVFYMGMSMEKGGLDWLPVERVFLDVESAQAECQRHSRWKIVRVTTELFSMLGE